MPVHNLDRTVDGLVQKIKLFIVATVMHGTILSIVKKWGMGSAVSFDLSKKYALEAVSPW